MEGSHALMVQDDLRGEGLFRSLQEGNAEVVLGSSLQCPLGRRQRRATHRAPPKG